MIIWPAGKQGTDGTEAPEASIMEGEAEEGPGKEDSQQESGVEQSGPGVVTGDGIRTDQQPGGVDLCETSGGEDSPSKLLPANTSLSAVLQWLCVFLCFMRAPSAIGTSQSCFLRSRSCKRSRCPNRLQH